MEYSRFAVEEMPGFGDDVARLAAEQRIALALRLERLRRGRVGDSAALGRGVFALRQAGLPPVHVQRRAARVTALCIGQSDRIALQLAEGNDAQARHPLFDAMRYLIGERDAAMYLELALAADPADIIEALNLLTRARASGLRALSPQADLASVARRIAALGFHLHIVAAADN